MKKAMVIGMLCIALAFGLVFTACPQPEALSSDATLKSFSIGTVAPKSLGTPNTDWLEVVPGDIFLSDTQLKNVRLNTSTADGADVWFARGPLGAPPNFDRTATFTALEHDDAIWVEVFSANLDKYLIYAFRVHKITPSASTLSILRAIVVSSPMGNQTYNFSRPAVKLGTPAPTWNGVTEAGELYVGRSEFAGAAPPGAVSVTMNVKALPELLDTNVRIAFASGTAEPDFTNDVYELPLAGRTAGDWVYMRCISGQEGGETIFYKIQLVEKNDSFELGTVTIGGQSVTPGTVGLSSFAGNEYYSTFLGDAGYLLGAKLAASNASIARIANKSADVTVSITPPSTSGITKIEYAHIDVDSRYAAEGRLTYGSSGALGNIPNGEWIAVKATNEVGDTGWYRFQVAKGSQDANLTAITINGTSIGAVLVANTAATGGTFASYTMPAAGPWANVQAGATASAGAVLAYASAATPATNITGWTNTTGLFANITSGQVVAIRVTSEDGLTVNYYKVRLLYGSNDATLTGIKIDGTSIGSVPAANTAANGTTAGTYSMPAGAGPWNNVKVEVTKGNSDAQVAFASAAAANTNVTVWTNTSGEFATFTENRYVVIRVISQDNTATNYYKVQLTRVITGTTQSGSR